MLNSITCNKRTAAVVLSLISIINLTALPGFSGNLSRLNTRRPNNISKLSAGGDKAKETANKMLANLPLRFEANRGQADSRFDYVLRGHNCGVLLSSSEALLASRAGARLSMKLAGANINIRGEGISELAAKSNYFLSNNPANWHANVPNYSKVKYENVYPGISVVYYGNKGELEYDFIVNAGADPAAIQLDFEGAKKIRLDAAGDLVLSTEQGEIRQHKPRAYQEINGIKKELASRYVLKGKHRAGIKVAAFDRSKRLIIDPVLSYSTYLGNGAAISSDIAVDAEGNAYITGEMFRDDFPATAGAFKTPNVDTAVFVMKLSADGSSLIYASYFAGSSPTSYSSSIAVDSAGNAYIAGMTPSVDFPTTPGAIQTTAQNPHSFKVFVTKLNATGSALVYSTYLGGTTSISGEHAYDIAVDAAGNAYVIGDTAAFDFPTTLGAFQTTKPHTTPKIPPPFSGIPTIFVEANGFVAKINATGTALLYSTYLGGDGADTLTGVAVDSAGSAYVTGVTRSTNFPVTAGAFQETNPHGTEPFGRKVATAFVTKLNPEGTALTYSTYFAGNNDGSAESPAAIAVDGAGNAYLAGSVRSGLPTTNALQSRPGGGNLMKSSNGGGNWSAYNDGLPYDFMVTDIVVDEGNPTTLYAGGGPGASSASIYKSLDGGLSWVASSTGIPDNSGVTDLAVAPKSPSTMYANVILRSVGALGNQIFKSTNGGGTWSQLNIPFDGNGMLVLEVDPTSPSTVYSGITSDGNNRGNLYKSSDGGATWNAISNGLTNKDVNALAIDPVNPSTLYVGTDKGLFKSLDGGQNWSALFQPDTFLNLAIDPKNTSTIYASTYYTNRGILSISGRGNSRRRANQNLKLEGAIKSVDGGQSWISINRGLPAGNRNTTELHLVVNEGNPATVCVTSDKGVFKSEDRGEHWSATNFQASVGAVAFDPANEATLYISSSGSFGDAFVAKLNPTGSALIYSTYLGGHQLESASGIALDSEGNAYVVGYTFSNNFPTTSDAAALKFSGISDAFISKLGAEGNVLLYSTYLGGNDAEFVPGNSAIALDPEGNVYVAGNTSSKNFPLKNPLQGTFAESQSNIFVVKMRGAVSNILKITSATISGKKLIVNGEGFTVGSTILVNGKPQTTSNDSQNPDTKLTAKKGGKKIKPGDSVMIQVQNPNGAMSSDYRFSRPSN